MPFCPLGERVGPVSELHGGLLKVIFRGTYRCDLVRTKDLCDFKL